jgi:hypothetical protein
MNVLKSFRRSLQLCSNCAVIGENHPHLDGFRGGLEVGVVFVDLMSRGYKRVDNHHVFSDLNPYKT